jgi:NAD(P)-dependent dehydrogenase (short-subunit alcohol dehydrogenase family)
MGLATAKRFVNAGMDHVFITGRRKEALDRAIAEIGRNVTAVHRDVADLSDLDRPYDEVRKQNRKLDVIFANAGVAELGSTAPPGPPHPREHRKSGTYRYADFRHSAAGRRPDEDERRARKKRPAGQARRSG